MRTIGVITAGALMVLCGCSSDNEVATTACQTICAGLECGIVEGCVCGSCPGELLCLDGKCCESDKDVQTGEDARPEPEVDVVNAPDLAVADPCLEACVGIECGLDGECGCGSCDKGYTCEEGTCVCVPKCQNAICGPDGCGGSCGECAEGLCGSDGQCHDGCPEPAFDLGQKVVTMAIGAGGHPGEALDVDGDPDTCAPAGDCEAGLNNQLSDLLDQIANFVDANVELAAAVDDGTIVLLAEMVGYEGEGQPFTLNMYIGEPVVPKDECDFQTEVCDYHVDSASIDVATCLPFITFPEAVVEGSLLTAGGPDALFSLSIPVAEDLILTVTANMAQVVATVVEDGETLTLVDGLVGGALRKDKLIESVDVVPDEQFDELPISKDMFKNILNMFVTPDVDTDLDGEPDAASLGLKFSTVGANLTGLTSD